MTKDDEYWRDKLSPEEYQVCREKGTERPFSGEYWDTTDEGVYHCRCCGEALFLSDSKFDAGCGWPSFFRAANAEVIEEASDDSLGMRRTEIMCKQCGAHLGHVFTDGPQPTGLRYCVNSLSVKLDKKAK
jgi:peptide-methionine (R)-S-oxide reductase